MNLNDLRNDFRDVLLDLTYIDEENGNLMIAGGYEVSDVVDILIGIVKDNQEMDYEF